MKHRKITAVLIFTLTAALLIGCSCVSKAVGEGESLINKGESMINNMESSILDHNSSQNSHLDNSNLNDSRHENSDLNNSHNSAVTNHNTSTPEVNGTDNSTQATVTDQISEDEAVEIALTEIGLNRDAVSNVKVELDYDDDRAFAQYEVEFYAGETKYSFEIDARDGSIVEYDIENK